MSQEFDTLQASVQSMESVADSAIALFAGLADQIRAAAGDRAASLALATELDSKKQALADAVVANTPQQPPPPGQPAGARR